MIHIVVEDPPADGADDLLAELARVIGRLHRENGTLRGALTALAACPKVLGSCPTCCQLLAGVAERTASNGGARS